MYDYESDPDDPDYPDDPAPQGIPPNLQDPLIPAPARNHYDEERRRQLCLSRIRRRSIRDASDPFDVTYEAFTSVYRLSQDLTFSLIDLIRPFVRRTSSLLAVPLEHKVLAVLSFYAHGSYQVPTGRQYDCPIGQSTLSAYITEITDALNEDAVLAHVIRFPSNVQETNYCIERNRDLGGKVPDIVGYTDGSLFKIKMPSVENNRQGFIGRKNYPCINAQITCDRRLYIMNVVAKFPGSTSDSFIFAGSALRRRMIALNRRRRCHLLGDNGYAQEPWMLTPFHRPEEGSPEARYNFAHCSDRNAAERCIGVLKERFRCVNDERVAHYDYIKVGKFVNAITVLHNLCVLANVRLYLDDIHHLRNINVNEEGPEELIDDDDDLDDPDVPVERRQARVILALGVQRRQEVVEELEHQRQ